MMNEMRAMLATLREVRIRRRSRFAKIRKYADVRLKPSNSKGKYVYYKAIFPGSEKAKYLGRENNKIVNLIREARFLKESLKVLDKDISLIENVMDNFESPAFQNVNGKLPKIYRSESAVIFNSRKKAAEWKRRAEEYKSEFAVIRPEELIHQTVDRKYVRSKSEALIYNHLYEAGYTFVYELPVKGKYGTFLPDFTILSEIDYMTEVRIEHQGKMSDPTYRDNAESREYKYWKSGFLPARDIYFTYDDCRGGFDMSPIDEILRSRVRPVQ